MVSRHFLLLMLGMFPIVAGCTYPIAGLRIPGAGGEADMVHQAHTYVAFGDFRTGSGFSPDVLPHQQQQYREEARLSYLKAIEVDPKYLPAYQALAQLQQRNEDLAGAVATYNKALAVTARDPNLWFELAMCHCRQKNWNDAITSLQKALELNPSNRNYMLTLGYTLGRANRLSESLAVLAQVVGEPRACYDIARMLRHMSQPDLARQYASLALQRDPLLPGLSQFVAELDGRSAPVATVAYQPNTEPTPQAQAAMPQQPMPAAAPMSLPPQQMPVMTSSGYPAIQQSVQGEPQPQVTANQTVPYRATRMPPLPVVQIRSVEQ